MELQIEGNCSPEEGVAFYVIMDLLIVENTLTATT